MNLQKLKEPFSAEEIHWRVGRTTNDNNKGLALAYIDSRAVMDRLDEVVGPENWQRSHDFGPDGEILCSIGIRINDCWIWKTDGAAQTNFEAEKGGLSDAFKRAAVSWGIGRYLYHLPHQWVKLDKNKNIKNSPSLPAWALPDSKEKIISELRKILKNKDKLGEARVVIEEIGYNSLKDIPKLSINELEKIKKKVA